jgi:hypothetical protein
LFRGSPSRGYSSRNKWLVETVWHVLAKERVGRVRVDTFLPPKQLPQKRLIMCSTATGVGPIRSQNTGLSVLAARMTPTNTSANMKPDTVRSRFIWPCRLVLDVRLGPSPCLRPFSQNNLLFCLRCVWTAGIDSWVPMAIGVWFG